MRLRDGRSRFVAGLVLAAALLFVGCGSDEESAEKASSLRIAVPQDVGPLNIFAQHEEPLTELVYDKLLAPSPYVEDPQPWLAKSVTKIDPSTWEVTIRDGVKWHDGEPFTAEDVKFTFDYFREAPTGRWTHHISEIPDVEQVEVIDEATVRLSCAFPCPYLGSITLADLPILPQHVWEGVEDPQTVTDLPVGTGPYRLTEYDSEQGYRFEANEDYFAGRPQVDRLVMPVIQDTSATFTALRAGELDAAARSVPPEILKEFENLQNMQVVSTDPLSFVELRLNYEQKPFDMHEFRQAFSLAIDRRSLVETVLLGQGRPGTQGYPHPDSPWTNPENEQPYDPDEARRILDELDFTDRDGDGVRETPDGEPLTFTIKVAGTEPTYVRTVELVSEQLGEVGIEAEVQTLDPGTIGELFDSRDFEVYINNITAHGVADPTQFIMSHFSGYLWGLPEVPYPEMATLIEEWKRTKTIEDRTDVLYEMQELFNSQPTAAVLYYPEEHWAFHPEAYDNWAESPGYGIVHKWSFLPEEVRKEANAVVKEFE